MAQSDWGERFLASTRGQIVSLLRRAPRTVNELAEALNLTDNAVRAHLATLERDGLVQQSGTRPGFRKPNLTYELTPDAGRFFPKPYGAVLQQLLSVLTSKMAADELEDVLREVGRRLAARFTGDIRAIDISERAAEAVAILGELGGLAEVESTTEGLVIHGFDCPLGEVVEGHPAVCRLAESLLTELVGVPVTEQCQKGSPPHCAFRVPVPEEGTDRKSSSTQS